MRSTSPKSRMQNIVRLAALFVLPPSFVAAQTQKPAVVNNTLNTMKQQGTAPHSVTLTWTASVPASVSPSNVVTGYNLYRSTTLPVSPVESNRINCAFVSATSCVDDSVAAGQTYYYVATALVGASGAARESVASQPPLKVTVPSP